MSSWLLQLPFPVALATIALLGYLVGSWRRKEAQIDKGGAQRDLKRANAVIRELEQIAKEVRRELASHHSSVLAFKERVDELGGKQEGASWQELSAEAEKILKPTMRLATQIAHAYDEIRQQTNLLMTFTEVRTDPLTGLSNRRALDESLVALFAMHTRYGNAFSIAIFDIDHFKKINDEQGHLQGDYVLQQVARLFERCVRETDIVTRYGGEEFVVLMPETDLAGACIFCERMRKNCEAKLSVTVSAGVAVAVDGDNARSLLSRADAALYSAKTAGRNLVFRHTGQLIEAGADSSQAPQIAEKNETELNKIANTALVEPEAKNVAAVEALAG